VFGLPKQGVVTLDDVDREYKRLARFTHPDVARDDGAAMAHLNRARDYAVQELTH
jgi:curved DNA-binding protein CbpA